VTSGWVGALDVTLEPRGDRTVVAHQRHSGPLVVQRPFHPEADGTCHVYVVHPPGGVAGGDRLRLGVTARPGARGLVTTPSATKLYRTQRDVSILEQYITIDAGARVEWLPMETIAFRGADARIKTNIDIEEGAGFFGWDILCLGRPASGERFDAGAVHTRLHVNRGGRPILREHLRVDAESAALDAPWGLRGQAILATLVATSAESDDVNVAREVLPAEGLLSTTWVGGLLVSRYLGQRADVARESLTRIWQALRPRTFGVEAVHPRVWAT
jgi:urease accessory protein